LSVCSWAIQFSLGLHEDGKGGEETRGVVKVSEEGGRALTPSKQGTESTGTRKGKMGIDGQRRGSEVKLQGHSESLHSLPDTAGLQWSRTWMCSVYVPQAHPEWHSGSGQESLGDRMGVLTAKAVLCLTLHCQCEAEVLGSPASAGRVVQTRMWLGSKWFEGEGAGREESQVEKEAKADKTCCCVMNSLTEYLFSPFVAYQAMQQYSCGTGRPALYQPQQPVTVPTSASYPNPAPNTTPPYLPPARSVPSSLYPGQPQLSPTSPNPISSFPLPPSGASFQHGTPGPSATSVAYALPTGPPGTLPATSDLPASQRTGLRLDRGQAGRGRILLVVN